MDDSQLDPAHLTPAASLNRMPLMPLAGVPLDAAPGTVAFDLLSAQALRQALIVQADALGLPDAPTADRDVLFRRFDAAFTASDPAVRAAVETVARRYGGHLAHLLITLARGEPASRAARPEWDASYWAHWAAVRQVWLGGGLVSGHFGQALAREVAIRLQAHRAACTVAVAVHPAVLPLIGAALSTPPGYDRALVWDFGGTAIKRAQAVYRDGALAALHLLPAVPSGLTDLAGLAPGAAPAVLGAQMADLLAAGWADAQGAGLDPAPVLVAAVACYLRDGQPLTRQGGAYSELNTLAANLAGWLGAEVSRRAGRPLAVQLIHDGTAAARTYAGATHAAVITLGTALGVGFPPPAAGLRPLAPDFAVTGA